MKPAKPLLLITGGSGYIGSFLVKQALAAGYRLHVLDSGPLPPDASLDEGLRNGTVTQFTGSITDEALVRQSLAGVAAVVHLAGVSDGRAGKADPELTRRVNADTMELLLAAARQAGAGRFVFASTMGVYGNRYAVPLTEDLAPAPVDPYSDSKALGERFVSSAAAAGFCTVSLRIAMVYGAGLRIREDFLVNKMCQLAVQKGSLSIAGGGQQRPQIHIADLAALALRLLDADADRICGEIFNAVESNPDLDAIAGAIRAVLPQTAVEKLPAREGEDSFAMDGGKLRAVLGFEPQVNLQSGIAQTIRYYQDAQQRRQL